MNRTALATLAVLGLAAAAHAQVLQPIGTPTKPYVPSQTDLSVGGVLGVWDLNAETRRVQLRLGSGASVLVDFWYPANAPQISLKPFIAPVPAVLITRALQAVQAAPSSFTLPFTLRVWRDQTTGAYYGYGGSELLLAVPDPVLRPGNSQAGALREVKIAANGSLDAGGYKTWGYLTLKSDSGNLRSFHFISSANTQLDKNGMPLQPITGPNAEGISSRVFGATLFIAFVGTPRGIHDEYLIAPPISWY